jgi:hypothetical protein
LKAISKLTQVFTGEPICGRNNIFCENPKHKKGLAEGSKKREV